MKRIRIFLMAAIPVAVFLHPQLAAQPVYREQYRPQIHFSPKEKWTNDPNGMVYAGGIYHLFFQYYPDSTVWGPMHWGHAVSSDLVHWQQEPIALYPDSLGYIFSGSAVLDRNNTSGFGTAGTAPLVAIFTQHDPKGEKDRRNDYQNQSIAYSLDNGKTWKKYRHNPVLKNPGMKDFRDPKVFWYQPGRKWVMTLAAGDRVGFYSSPDLKTWKRESEFGNQAGAHGGVWECPDLFTLDDKGKLVWVLIVNINPGGPNKGSATQYFLGSFDGREFKPYSTGTKWVDYGPDDYAGVTWSNTGGRRIFLGWMSNWLYANTVPTGRWRNAMTIPRELSLKHAGGDLRLASTPVKELDKIGGKPMVTDNKTTGRNMDLSEKIQQINSPCRIDLTIGKLADFSLVLSNQQGQELSLGYNQGQNQFYIDRSKSGKTDFNQEFAARHTAPRFASSPVSTISLIIDNSSVELFADDGLTVMTEIFFPDTPYNQMHLQSPGPRPLSVEKMEYVPLKSIWK